jgi:hypothetical protein
MTSFIAFQAHMTELPPLISRATPIISAISSSVAPASRAPWRWVFTQCSQHKKGSGLAIIHYLLHFLLSGYLTIPTLTGLISYIGIMTDTVGVTELVKSLLYFD